MSIQEELRRRYERVRKKSKPGEGKRFAALEGAVGANPKVRSPGAVAAEIGRRKYGKGRFQKMAARGRAAA